MQTFEITYTYFLHMSFFVFGVEKEIFDVIFDLLLQVLYGLYEKKLNFQKKKKRSLEER